MVTTGFYPVVMSEDVAASAAFYREALGFETTYDSAWYVSLRLGAFELALVASDHPTVPATHRTPPRGIILNVEVDDIDPVHAHLTGRLGLTPVLPLRDEDFGQRHVIVEGPDGVLLDVIQPIPPTPEFAHAYTGG